MFTIKIYFSIIYKELKTAHVRTGEKMRIITIANQKGGVAKTTTALNMASGLKREGKSVLIVDLDAQGDLTDSAGAKARADLTLSDVIQQDGSGADVKKTIVPTRSGLDLIPSTLELAALEQKSYTLSLARLPYDFIVIDCPPNMGGNTLAALRSSDELIIPTTADYYAYKSVLGISKSVEYLQEEEHAKIKIAGILITRHNARTVISRQLLEDLKNLSTNIGTKLYNTIIRESVAVKESQLAREDIFTYDSAGNAAADYSAFVREYLTSKSGRK